MLLFEVKNQKLTRLDVLEPATDSEQYLKAKFTFNDADWNGKAKTAYFRLGEAVYKALLNSNNECVVPSEVLIRSENRYARTQGSKIYVSLVGELNTTRITTNEVQVELNASGYSEAEEPAEPTESEYQQIITQYANNEAAINEAKAECEAARADLVGVKNIFANAIKGNLSGAVVKADDVSPVEHEMTVSVHGKNFFDVSKITNTSTATNNGDGSITIAANTYYCRLNQTLREVCPQLKSGDTAVLSFDSTSKNTKYMYFHGLQGTWIAGYYLKITDEILNSYITIYGFADNDELYGQECVISNIQIEKGTTATEYEPFIDPSTMTVTKCGKNLIPYPFASQTLTYNGVTYTDNGDGSVTIEGTVENDGVSFMLVNTGAGGRKYLPKGTYYLSCPEIANNSDVFLSIFFYDDNETSTFTATSGKNQSFTLEKGQYYGLYFRVYGGSVIKKITVKPQIEVGSVATVYEKYNATEHTPSSDGTVDGIASLSPNMTILTDTEGAVVECEYIKDTNKVIQKIADEFKISVSQSALISSVTLNADQWVGEESPYFQKVTVSGATKNSKIDLNPTVEQLNVFHNKDLAFVVENDDGNITVYCIGQKPTNNYTMQATLTEVIIDG